MRVPVVVVHPGGQLDVVVDVAGPSATVADLARAVGALLDREHDPQPLTIDGRCPDLEVPLADAGLRPAATISLGLPPPPRWPEAEEAAVAELQVTGGLDAGRRWPLAPGVRLLPAGPGNDGILVEVDHDGGVRVERVATADRGRRPAPVRARPHPAADAPPGLVHRRRGPAGTVAFDRPPRVTAPAPAAAVAAPSVAGSPPAVAAPLGLATAAPLLTSAVVVAVTGDVRFALFAALSPVAAGLAAVERRWRARRERRAARRHVAEELGAFEERLRRLVEAEVERRHERWPDPAEIARRAAVPSVRLWERVPGAAGDFLELRVGRAELRWEVPVIGIDLLAAAPAAVVERVASTLPDVPVVVELGGGGVVGVAGPRHATLAVARSLVAQAAVLHGPAHLKVAVRADPDRVDDWAWTAWLPHTADPTGGDPRLSTTAAGATELLGDLSRRKTDPAPDHPAMLLVVDGGSVAREALRRTAGSVVAVVLASDVHQLPAACTHVVSVAADGEAEVGRPGAGERLVGVRADGIAGDTARAAAMALARFDDPEASGTAAPLPAQVPLLPLLGLDPPSPEAVADRWRAAGGCCALPIGVGPEGVVSLDLVGDGPHGLVAGTTGAGKSELLRSLVAGLAATADPDHLTFVLVDFKGGSAFDECRRLPHTVGLVTDLDPGEASRALRCLEAELRHRERVLRDAAVTDLPAYLAAGAPGGPLPRLVIVVDEFATLKAELPGFVDALVGVAQRGRSLGMHLVLATQRPGGAVSEHIRANAGFTVALRVATPAESADVVGCGDAAAIPRRVPGRALVRRGPGEVVAVQTAFAAAPRTGPGAERSRVVAWPLASRSSPPPSLPPSSAPSDTDLRALVDAVATAFQASGRPRPRRPWPPPLPAAVSLDAVARPVNVPGDLPQEVAFAVADDPDRQRRFTTGWRPREGNLLLHGVVGAGTTTAVASVALAVAGATSPDRCHLYVLDQGAGELGALAGLPHCGAVVGATEAERQRRLVRHLVAELRRRQAGGAGTATSGAVTEARPAGTAAPSVVVAIDGFPALASAWGDGPGADVLDSLLRVVADGPEVGIHAIITGDRAASIPPAVGSLTRQRLLFRVADPHDHGLGRAAPGLADLPPGRAVDTRSGLFVQVAEPGAPLGQAVAEIADRWPSTGAGRPTPVDVLAEVVPVASVAAHSRLEPGRWAIAVGRRDTDLGVAVLEVRPGDHVLVAGPARSGTSAALAALAASAGGPGVVVAGPRSRLPAAGPGWPCFGAGDTAGAVAAAHHLVATRGRCLLLVDDADDVADDGNHLDDVLVSGPAGLVVVASGRPEALRSSYAHWTRTLRRSRLGLLLRPSPELDGELLGVRLPRHPPVPMVAGRGYLVQGGEVELVQVAAAGCTAPP